MLLGAGSGLIGGAIVVAAEAASSVFTGRARPFPAVVASATQTVELLVVSGVGAVATVTAGGSVEVEQTAGDDVRFILDGKLWFVEVLGRDGHDGFRMDVVAVPVVAWILLAGTSLRRTTPAAIVFLVTAASSTFVFGGVWGGGVLVVTSSRGARAAHDSATSRAPFYFLFLEGSGRDGLGKVRETKGHAVGRHGLISPLSKVSTET